MPHAKPKWSLSHDAVEAFDSLLSEAGDRFFEVAYRIAVVEAGTDAGTVGITKDHIAEAFSRFRIGTAQSGSPCLTPRNG